MTHSLLSRRRPEADAVPRPLPGLVVAEIYRSIQGESSFAGLSCTFVRLTACHLRCTYCDTAYAFHGGTRLPMEQVLEEVRNLGADLVELTGGEPLLQRTVFPFMTRLCDEGATVLVETSGALDISPVDPRVHIIMDLKCPGSGEEDANEWENIPLLRQKDEVKFVIGDRTDYEWSRDVVRGYDLHLRCGCVLFSPVFGKIEPRVLVNWILEDRLPVRFQIQLHKAVWPPDQRGV